MRQLIASNCSRKERQILTMKLDSLAADIARKENHNLIFSDNDLGQHQALMFPLIAYKPPPSLQRAA